MEGASDGQVDLPTDIQPYKIHVSTRYLQLTRRKLELTRLPREPDSINDQNWTLGTPKAALEPLIDFWLEKFNWRNQEATINQELPQFRTTLSIPISNVNPSKPLVPSDRSDENKTAEESLRIHFVHRPSTAPDAIPLLYVHGSPGSFYEITKIIGPLTSPIPTHLHSTEDSPSFHVVAPSIPGFGFSDASNQEGFGVKETADLYDKLMEKLEYRKYVVHASQSGFPIARMLAMNYPAHCVGVHTSNPPPPPTQFQPLSKPGYLKTAFSRIPFINFFSPSHTTNSSASCNIPDNTNTQAPATRAGIFRPQTISFALCDSPAGLLATILDQLYSTHHLPFWSQADVLTWTMLHWLPGPEAGLRWLHNTKNTSVYGRYMHVPLGISEYVDEEDMQVEKGGGRWWRGGKGGPGDKGGKGGWLASVQRVEWIKRRQGCVGTAGWDVASDVILDLREFCAVGRRDGWLDFGSTQDPLTKDERTILGQTLEGQTLDGQTLDGQAQHTRAQDLRAHGRNMRQSIILEEEMQVPRTPETAINISMNNTVDDEVKEEEQEKQQETQDGSQSIRNWLIWRYWHWHWKR
ncbi:alpha/beta-hydrolase [Microthyrium microscopicum]|uniref:Alpha/beta-hydrolase n=1 Tax=Microthyrium microscopicum TaxID=703497 RepID=A0A6A6TXR1_9PEZI|nr:alpha/beta-hydrolase [Microthyrium microscopicum]